MKSGPNSSVGHDSTVRAGLAAAVHSAANGREHVRLRHRRRYAAHHGCPYPHGLLIENSCRQTVGTYAASRTTAPDFQGAIGVTQDAVKGVDITVPIYQFTETHYLPAAAVTNSYKGALFSLTGKVNSGGFRGFAAGEVLFLGATGAHRGTGPDDDWEITFRFATSPTVTGLSVGSSGDGISKEVVGVPLGPLRGSGAHQREHDREAPHRGVRRAGARPGQLRALGV